MADRDPGSLNGALEALRARVEASRAPGDLWARIAERAGSPRRGGRAKRRAAVATAAACAIVLAGAAAGVAWWRLRPVELAGFELASASPDLRSRVEGDVLSVDAGQAALRIPALAVELSVPGPARLRREAKGVRVVEGTATFEAARREREPLCVYVSDGRIEVLGTRFTVSQRDGSGDVTLERGSIRFVDARGREMLLRPGERLRWPSEPPVDAPSRPVVPAPVPAAPPRRPPPKGPPSPGPAAPAVTPAPRPAEPAAEALAGEQRRVLAEIDRLRIRREDDLLVGRLDEVLAEPVAEPFRERLSFERCDVLAHEAGDERRACAEIARHLEAYRDGEYTARLESLRRSLGCHP